jgi:hypothetical protein
MRSMDINMDILMYGEVCFTVGLQPRVLVYIHTFDCC